MESVYPRDRGVDKIGTEREESGPAAEGAEADCRVEQSSGRGSIDREMGL